MEIQFLVRRGRFNMMNPSEVTANVHIKIDDTYINADFDEYEYEYYNDVFSNSIDIDEIIEAISKCCDRILSYIYNSEKSNAEKIKKVIRTDDFRKELAKYLVNVVDTKIDNTEHHIASLEKFLLKLKDKKNELVEVIEK